MLGARVRRARKAKNWSLDKVAEKTGLSKSFLCEVENGRKYPRLETLQRMEIILKARLI
jgi:transcriptional regulator with XRE-family HTH domain